MNGLQGGRDKAMIEAIQSAREELRASQERYRLVTDSVGDVIWTVDLPREKIDGEPTEAVAAAIADAILQQWRFSFVSRAVEQVFGYTPSEMVGVSLDAIAPPASYAAIRQALAEDVLKCLQGPADPSYRRYVELEFLAKDGASRWCEVVCMFLQDDHAVPIGVLGIARDVTKRRHAERALRESEGMLRGLFENLPDLIIVVDRDAKVLFANRFRTGTENESLVGAWGPGFMISEHQVVCGQSLAQALATGSSQAVEVQDVFGMWWSARVVPLAGDAGFDRALILCTDVTKERLAAEAVKKEQQLLRQLLELHERERQLFAYEIHDGFSQQLAGALFRLQSFRETLARDPVEAWASFDFATRLVRQAIDETRRLISGLRPPILDEMGVIEAIEYLTYEHTTDGGPEIDFDHDLPAGRLAAPLESAIFRVVQESLQNACRHSRSEKVCVTIVQRDDRICVDVRDWGVGFKLDEVKEQRFGLRGIRERVRLLGGRVTIESAPNEGTQVSVELPLLVSTGEEVES